MINIRQLDRPTKRSGHELEPGKKTEVRGVIIINNSKKTLWVDKFTPFYKRKTRGK